MTDDEIVEQIRDVLFHKGGDCVFDSGSLTPREKWVMELRAQGATVKELATARSVKEWRIRHITKRAKAKIVNRIVDRLIARREGER